MYPSSDENLNKETDKEVYFFTPSFYPLDNFSAHAIKLWDMRFSTAEHAYQWKKFSLSHPNIAEKILDAKSPHSVKIISDENSMNILSAWHEEKVGVMEEILVAKTQQHEDVRDALKRTGKKDIIENSPIDSFWGNGPQKDGKNMIGKIWMKIRNTTA